MQHSVTYWKSKEMNLVIFCFQNRIESEKYISTIDETKIIMITINNNNNKMLESSTLWF